MVSIRTPRTFFQNVQACNACAFVLPLLRRFLKAVRGALHRFKRKDVDWAWTAANTWQTLKRMQAMQCNACS